jgi:D-alanyl-D-alanine dipeptidase
MANGNNQDIRATLDEFIVYSKEQTKLLQEVLKEIKEQGNESNQGRTGQSVEREREQNRRLDEQTQLLRNISKQLGDRNRVSRVELPEEGGIGLLGYLKLAGLGSAAIIGLDKLLSLKPGDITTAIDGIGNAIISLGNAASSLKTINQDINNFSKTIESLKKTIEFFNTPELSSIGSGTAKGISSATTPRTAEEARRDRVQYEKRLEQARSQIGITQTQQESLKTSRLKQVLIEEEKLRNAKLAEQSAKIQFRSGQISAEEWRTSRLESRQHSSTLRGLQLLSPDEVAAQNKLAQQQSSLSKTESKPPKEPSGRFYRGFHSGFIEPSMNLIGKSFAALGGYHAGREEWKESEDKPTYQRVATSGAAGGGRFAGILAGGSVGAGSGALIGGPIGALVGGIGGGLLGGVYGEDYVAGLIEGALDPNKSSWESIKERAGKSTSDIGNYFKSLGTSVKEKGNNLMDWVIPEASASSYIPMAPTEDQQKKLLESASSIFVQSNEKLLKQQIEANKTAVQELDTTLQESKQGEVGYNFGQAIQTIIADEMSARGIKPAERINQEEQTSAVESTEIIEIKDQTVSIAIDEQTEETKKTNEILDKLVNLFENIVSSVSSLPISRLSGSFSESFYKPQESSTISSDYQSTLTKPSRVQTNAETEKLMTDVYSAYRTAGFSDAQAKAVVAEVGREGSFKRENIFGSHIDPANKHTNIGMFSWQKDRGEKLKDHLESKGLIKDGKMIQSQEALIAQAEFAKMEMETTHSKSGGKEFLSDENIPEGKAARLLGKGVIAWRYDDPKYRHHHGIRAGYYQKISDLVEKTGSTAALTTEEKTPTESLKQETNASEIETRLSSIRKHSGVDVSNLESSFAARVAAFSQEAKELFGEDIGIASAYRPPTSKEKSELESVGTTQASLKGPKGYVASTYGSMHGRGEAVDITLGQRTASSKGDLSMNNMTDEQKEQWKQLAEKHGLNLPMTSGPTIEWWHLEPQDVYSGKRGDLGLRGEDYTSHIKSRALSGKETVSVEPSTSEIPQWGSDKTSAALENVQREFNLIGTKHKLTPKEIMIQKGMTPSQADKWLRVNSATDDLLNTQASKSSQPMSVNINNVGALNGSRDPQVTPVEYPTRNMDPRYLSYLNSIIGV